MIRIYTSYYRETNCQRHSEILECLKRNLDNPAIGEVCLLLESEESPPFKHEKLRVRPTGTRPTYSHFFEWIHEVTTSAANLSVIANSDIYFSSSIASFEIALSANQCAVLARWDVKAPDDIALLNRNDSQDAWILRGPLKKALGDFCVGVPRCDNRFLYELKRAGYEVINPAFSVRAYHLHAGQRSEYKTEQLENFVDPPYAYLWPHNLWSLPRTLWHNFRHPDVKVGWRLDWRKISSSLPFRVVRKVLRCFKLPVGSAT